MIVESQVASRRSQALGALGALAAAPRVRGRLAGIGDIIAGITGAITGTIQSFQAKQQSDTDRYWAGEADKKYAQWLDYWTRTGELPEPRCAQAGREGAPWCARAWERFLMTVNAEKQITFRTFATPEIVIAGILFVLAVRASGRA